ncbi:MAG: WG repeat-containing protein [Candidatus Kapaibacterium sp.]|nr:MAG: WG repeat-containing protein [Candidatus Kapabacteria bacterium]
MSNYSYTNALIYSYLRFGMVFHKKIVTPQFENFFERLTMRTNRFCCTIAQGNPLMLLVFIVFVSFGSTVPSRSQMLQLPPAYDQETKVYRLFTDDDKPFAPMGMCDKVSQDVTMPNRLIVQQLQLNGVIDLLGNVIVPFMYDEIYFCQDIKCFVVRQREKWGLMGKNGELKTDIRYDAMRLNKFQTGTTYYLRGWAKSNTGFIFVQEEGKWGMIDSTGKEVIPPQYTNYYPTTTPQRGVWMSTVTNDGIRWGKLSPNGSILLPFVYDTVSVVQHQNDDEIQDGLEYVIAKHNGKWGIISHLIGSSAASVVLPFQYGSVYEYDSSRLLFSVQSTEAHDARWGLIKISNLPPLGNSTRSYTTILPFAFDAPFESIPSEPTAIGAKKGKFWGLIDSTGKQLLPFLFDKVAVCVAPNRYYAQLHGKNVIVDNTGAMITPHGYDDLDWMESKIISIDGTVQTKAVIRTTKNGFYGLLSSTGTVLLEAIAENSFFFNSGLAYIHTAKNSPGAYINTEGTVLTDAIYGDQKWYEIFHLKTGLLRKVSIGSHFGVINSEGKEIVPVEYERVWIFNGGKTLFAKQTPEKGGKWSYFSDTGKPFFTNKYDSATAYTTYQTLVLRNGKWGVMCDTTAQELVPPTYDSVAAEDKSPVMQAWRGSKVCLVRTDTHREITALYDFVEDKYRGAIRVRRGGKWGIVSADSLTLGQEIVPPRYDYICEAKHGFAQVRMGTKYGYVALKGADAGKEVVPPLYDIATPANKNGEVVVVKGGVEVRLQLPMVHGGGGKNP